MYVHDAALDRMVWDGSEVTMDNGISYLVGQLQYIEPRIYEVKYRNIVYQDLCPVSSEAGPWAESISFEIMDMRAQAEFLSSNGLDVPIAEVSGGLSTTPVAHAGLGYQYSLQELRASAQLGQQLDFRRGNAVRRGVEELAQKTCFLGNTERGLPGMLNNANVSSALVAADGTGSTTEWVNKTPTQILRDVNAVLSGTWATTKTVELMDTLLLPPTQYADIVTRSTGVELHYSVWDLLRDRNIYTARTGNPLTIQPLSELEGLGAGATDRMMAYRRDPEVLTFHFPMPLQFLAPQPKVLGFIVPGEFRISGCEIRYPGACYYADGI